MKTMNWRNRKKFPDHNGFSLVEMMMVVMLIGLLAGISGPPMFRYLKSNQMQTRTDRLVADMQYARAVAVSTGQTHQFTCTNNSYTLFNTTTGNVVRQVNFDNGAQLDLAQSANFFPWGMAESRNFVLSMNDMSREIILLPTGMVEVDYQ